MEKKYHLHQQKIIQTKKQKIKKTTHFETTNKKKKIINKKHQLQHLMIKHNENAPQQNKYHATKYLNLH